MWSYLIKKRVNNVQTIEEIVDKKNLNCTQIE